MCVYIYIPAAYNTQVTGRLRAYYARRLLPVGASESSARLLEGFR